MNFTDSTLHATSLPARIIDAVIDWLVERTT
jgi:hypothetical protein